MRKTLPIVLSLLLCFTLLIISTNDVLADGTETLGEPVNLTIASGTGIVAAGTGMVSQPGTINLTVPTGATVQQVLLYWEGQMLTNVDGDDTILVNGTEVTGQKIGGPAFFFRRAYSSAFRADITSLNVISAGANAVTLSGLEFSKVANGAGIMVIYDDGTIPAIIDIRDGIDLAYIGFPENELRHGTVAQTITFGAVDFDRTAEIVVFASSVEGAISGEEDTRPDSIEVTVGDQVNIFSNPLFSSDGEEWDTTILAVDVPAGIDNVTIQLFSRDDENSGDTPASMTWIGTGLAISAPTAMIDIEKATNGEDADTPTGPEILVGDPVNWTYVVENTGDVTLNNVTVTDDQGVTVTCPQTTLLPGASMTCTASGIATAGQYANIGSVVGTPENGGSQVTDSDPSHYVGVALAAVGDKVFRDGNGNGIQDAGEPGVDGIIVELYTSDNTLISTTTTVDGMYLFDELQPGDYYVKFINPTGAGTCTIPNAGDDDTVDSDATPVAADERGPACQTATFTLSAGQSDLTRDLGLVYLEPSISLEKATNGEDADTPTGPMITVGGDVTWTYTVVNTGNVDLVNVTVTDDQGVTVTCPQTTLAVAESMVCTATGIAIEGQYANVGTVIGTPVDESADVSDTDPSHYFGYLPAAVGNLVFGDINPDGTTPGDIAGGNGIQDGDEREQGIDGIIVKLYNSADELISTTVTTNGGQYLFDDLVPGEYCLVFVNPGDTGVWTIANAGEDDAVDSDVSVEKSEPEGDAIGTPCFTLTSGQTDLTWDAGLIGLSGTASAGAGNRVWVDNNSDETLNANGLQDAGELGYPNGVTVQIFTEDGELVQTTTTDAEGIYGFNALDPGSYYIEFTLPASCQLTQQKAGDNDDLDSDIVDLVNNRTAVFTLAPFETNPRFDMGIVCPTGLNPEEEPLQFRLFLPIVN